MLKAIDNMKFIEKFFGLRSEQMYGWDIEAAAGGSDTRAAILPGNKLT